MKEEQQQLRQRGVRGGRCHRRRLRGAPATKVAEDTRTEVLGARHVLADDETHLGIVFTRHDEDALAHHVAQQARGVQAGEGLARL